MDSARGRYARVFSVHGSPPRGTEVSVWAVLCSCQWRESLASGAVSWLVVGVSEKYFISIIMYAPVPTGNKEWGILKGWFQGGKKEINRMNTLITV